jgi:dienelactone hydrolase
MWGNFPHTADDNTLTAALHDFRTRKKEIAPCFVLRRTMRALTVPALSLTLALAFAAPAGAQLAPVPFPNEDCYQPTGDPEPGSQEWQERDAHNMICAGLRNRDQLASPAYGYQHNVSFPGLHLDALAEQAQDPTNPRGGVTTLVPGSRASDPFRTVARWTELTGATVTRVTFPSQNGATLRGYVFEPPPTVPEPDSGFPGVVITDGSVQGYQNLYFWAAEDLASNGYVAMTYDVQGQGDSDLAGDDCPGDCTGVPYQQDYNFFQGAEDALSFFLSDANPARASVDGDRVGLAGHSLGASAVSEVGQCDSRVKAIVAWDNLRAPDGCDGATIPAEFQSGDTSRVPALGLSNDYGFWVEPTNEAPDPLAKQSGYSALAQAGIDTAEVVLRGATHLEYTYIPLVLPASRLGERFASHYTVAWFDRYLKGDPAAYSRLTATEFDGGADGTSIGAGDFSTDAALADPTNPIAGNVPYKIAGMPVANALSFYYDSAYSLTDPATGQNRTCADMADPASCPPPAVTKKPKKKPR